MRWAPMLLAALLISSGAVVLATPDLLQWMSVQPTTDDPAPLLAWQGGESERWFVVLVDFEDEQGSSTGVSIDAASNVLQNEVIPYFQAASGGGTPRLDLHPNVHRASMPSSAYGLDTSAGRDTGKDGTFLPALLAEEVLSKVEPADGWSAYDLDGDGAVDRFLILHTSRGQESGSGGSGRIWSHFTRLIEPMHVDSSTTAGHYTMATLRGGTDVVGTVVHEMLHQLGAVDLYPVHDPSWAGSWHGLGDWDLMASGNWNGGGSWPALPTSATAMLTGLQEPQWIDLAFPIQREGPCLGPTVNLPSRAEGVSSVAVRLTDTQSVHMERIGGNAYDNRLPGDGVLVTIADASMLHQSSNEVNVDPGRPYLMVLEADNDSGLLTGRDSGTEGDLFQHNMSFGAEGRLIYDHAGTLVAWTATVSIENGTAHLSFSAPSCGQGLALEGTVHGISALAGQPIVISMVNIDAPCTLGVDLAFDGGGAINVQPRLIDVGVHDLEVSPETEMVGDVVDRLHGTIECGASVLHVDLGVSVLNRIPAAEAFVAFIPTAEASTLTVPVSSDGTGSSRYSILIEGPLSRIASTSPYVQLRDDEAAVQLDIDPADLLVDGMIVRGEVVLVDLDGTRTSLTVVLTAGTDSTDVVLGLPRQALMGVLLMLLGASLLLPKRAPQRNDANDMDTERWEHRSVIHDQEEHVEWTTTEPFR